MLLYTFIAGILMDVPRLPQLQETIRNLYFHVCMWFVMMILFIVSVVYAIKYLRKNDLKYDICSRQFAVVGFYFGLLGYATGAIWMSYTWADPNNPAFEYELACQEMCGNGHYSMKGAVKVVTRSEFILWRAKQKAKYLQVFPDKDPTNAKPATADTTKSSPPVAAQ